MRGFNVIVWALMLTFCVVFWVSVIGCVVPSSGPPRLLDQARSKAVAPENVTSWMAVGALAEASFESNKWACVRVLNMPQLPDVDGGLPILMAPHARPLVGQEWRLNWLTRAVASQSGDRPDLQSALLVSVNKPGPASEIPGCKGGMLQVPPDYVLVPSRVADVDPAGRPDVPFEFVQDGKGRIMLRMVWPRSLSGLRVWCQLLVSDPRVACGSVTTPMVEVLVGSK